MNNLTKTLALIYAQHMMDLPTPTNAYLSLSPQERDAVDQYVNMVEIDAVRRGERVAVYADKPIPKEIVVRSRGIFERHLVLAAVSERLRAVAELQDISPRRVISEQAALAFSNIADFLRVGSFGEVDLDLSKATREQLRAVKTVKIVDSPQGRRYEITLYDKQPSLAALREIMDMPLIADYNHGNKEQGKLGKSDDAQQAYSNLLETMRP